MELAFLLRCYACAIQMCSPSTASSLQSCLLCCQPELMPGRLPARPLLPAQYMSCRVLDCMGHTLHTGLGNVQRSCNRSDLQTLCYRIQWFPRILAVMPFCNETRGRNILPKMERMSTYGKQRHGDSLHMRNASKSRPTQAIADHGGCGRSVAKEKPKSGQHPKVFPGGPPPQY